MADEPAQNEGGSKDSGETPAAEQFQPITTQDDLNRVIADRISRERAKYADYKDLKSKAARLDEIEQANKSEIEKAAEARAAAERERDQARVEILRYKVAAKHGITDDDAELFLTGTDEETLTRQAERLSARDSDRKKQGNHVSKEGNNPRPSEDSDATFASEFFGAS